MSWRMASISRAFARAVHVMVIDERHADRLVRSPEPVQHGGERVVIVRGHRPVLRLLVNDLEELSARVAHERRVRQVQIHLRAAIGRLILQVAAREDGEAEAVLLQERSQIRRPRAPFVERGRAQLDPLKPASATSWIACSSLPPQVMAA